MILHRIKIHTLPLVLDAAGSRDLLELGEESLIDIRAGRLVGVSSLALYQKGVVDYRAAGLLASNEHLRAHVAQVVANHFNR